MNFVWMDAHLGNKGFNALKFSITSKQTGRQSQEIRLLQIHSQIKIRNKILKIENRFWITRFLTVGLISICLNLNGWTLWKFAHFLIQPIALKLRDCLQDRNGIVVCLRNKCDWRCCQLDCSHLISMYICAKNIIKMKYVVTFFSPFRMVGMSLARFTPHFKELFLWSQSSLSKLEGERELMTFIPGFLRRESFVLWDQ